MVKSITLTQPWATLVAIGAKHIETRSWKTDYRGSLAIHAAKGFPRWAQELCLIEPFYTYLKDRPLMSLPRGCVIAIADLRSCKLITLDSELPPEPERSFGDYTAGRYAWRLDNLRPLSRPIPAKGALGLWEWNRAV